MLSVEQALQLIVERVEAPRPRTCGLHEARGLSLAEDIASTIDSPPFDKALMDGFAVRSADCQSGGVELVVVEEVTAGRTPTIALGEGQATRITTGAPLPENADAVIPIEQTEFDDPCERVTLQRPVTAESNLLRRGASMQVGDVVLRTGTRLAPPQLGLLAELGHAEVPVFRRPRIAVLATGDELVPIDETPGPGQIRNSNETMLAAQIEASGGIAVRLGIARDDRQQLAERIEAGLQEDLLLLSGGVSAGHLDLVPSELDRAGVEKVFHKVRIKPGKPLWFGCSPHGRAVFGLPGNPVSSLVCFEVFVRAAIDIFTGRRSRPQGLQATLQGEVRSAPDRPVYYPSNLHWTDSGPVVRPVPWAGSADLRATADANAMTYLPEGEHSFAAGDTVHVIPWGMGLDG